MKARANLNVLNKIMFRRRLLQKLKDHYDNIDFDVEYY